MPDHETPPTKPWLNALLAAARTFSALTGLAGFGLFCGLAYAVQKASQAGPSDDVFVWLIWIGLMAIYGSIGFVAGLAVGLLGLLFVWILRLAHRIAAGIEHANPPDRPGRTEEA